MAEVVGLVASIVGLVQLAGQATALGYGYIGGVKRATKDLQDLSKELSSLSQVLIILRNYVDKNPHSEALQTLNTKDGPLDECETELKALILKMEPKDGFKGFLSSLKWPLKEAETLQHIARIERQKSLFEFALSTDHISLTEEVKACAQKTELAVQEVQATTIALSSWTQKEDNIRINEHRLRVLNWLYPGDFDTRHLEISKKRQKNTGAWLLKEPVFQEWSKKQPYSRLLWGYGIPGAGKTFLSSMVIEHLEAQVSAGKLGIAYIYFNYKEQLQQGPVKVLSSLVKQLACRLPYLTSDIEGLYDKLAGEQKKPTLGDLYAILIGISRAFAQTFIIIDALDECDQEDQRIDLLPLFHRIGKKGVNLFLTSRQHPEDIQESFKDIAKIQLYAQEQDIRVYVQQKIDESPRARRLVKQGGLQDRIISELIDCANGMFLLVRFHIEYICQQTSAKQILKTLTSLKTVSKKSPLDPTYDRIMENIRSQPESCTELAFGILSWLVKTRRILTVDEIQAAVSIEPDRYELDELDLPDRATILDVCAGLVTIDERNNIRLVHYTVQEYLVKNNIIPEDADFKLALSCITYMSFDAFSGACTNHNIFKARLESYPFLNYTSRYLISHIRACDEDLTVDSVFKLLKAPGHIEAYLQALNRRDTHGLENVLFYGSYDEGVSPLHIAAKFGHCAVFEQLLDDGFDIWTKDRLGNTALHYAAMEGNKQMVHLILDKNIPTSVVNGGRRTALGVAAEWGNEEAARALIERGADISACDWGGWTAASLATYEGRDVLVKLLLDKGADFSTKDYTEWAPIHWAVELGHEEVFELLVENLRSDDLLVDVKRKQTALDIGFGKNRYTMVKRLIEKCSDLSKKSELGQRALYKAAAKGWEVVVGLILERGVDVPVGTGSEPTALDIATSEGHDAVVAVLKAALERQSNRDKDIGVVKGDITVLGN